MKNLVPAILLFLFAYSASAQNYMKYYVQGNDLFTQGEYQQAVEAYTEAISYKTDAAVLFAARGKAYRVLKNNKQAIADYTKAVDLNPKEAEYYFERGKTYLLIEEQEKAKANFEAVLKIENSGQLRAFALHYLGNKESAITEMKATIENDGSAWNQYKLACLYAMQHNGPEAISALESSINSGFQDFNLMLSDTELKKLRFTNSFKTLMRENNVEFSFNFENEVRSHVESKIGDWQKRGKYEKSDDYLARIESEREQKIIDYKKEKLDAMQADYFEIIDWKSAEILKYVADYEVFEIKVFDAGNILLPVPITEAEDFENNFKLSMINSGELAFTEERVWLSKLQVFMPNTGKFYTFNISEFGDYVSSELDVNFSEIQLEMEQHMDISPVYERKTKQHKKLPAKPDVDLNIPKTKSKSKNTYALIIGNEDYSSFQTNMSSEINVDFATNDAYIFRQYVEKTMGVPSKNIIYLENATFAQMRQALNKMKTIAKVNKGKARIVFYYAGHGLPDEKTKEPYLIPVDVSGSDLYAAIKLNDVYSMLTEYPTQQVVTFIDACFSGGARNTGLVAVRGVRVKPKRYTPSGNLLVFTSSTGDESSSTYYQMRHGMFTYFILKKLQETEGKVNMSELSEYITEKVRLESVLINSKEQTPQIFVSPDVDKQWKDWTLRE